MMNIYRQASRFIRLRLTVRFVPRVCYFIILYICVRIGEDFSVGVEMKRFGGTYIQALFKNILCFCLLVECVVTASSNTLLYYNNSIRKVRRLSKHQKTEVGLLFFKRTIFRTVCYTPVVNFSNQDLQGVPNRMAPKGSDCLLYTSRCV